MTVASAPEITPPSSNPRTTLERFLCGDLQAIPAPEVLRARRLEAWAYTVLPTGHPFKAICKPAFMMARARHELTKQEVLGMVRAWNAVGIEPVLYKGFALAEFTYPHPGTRFHGDVDVLVRPEDFRRALEVGYGLGWQTPQAMEHWSFNPNPNPHELSLKKDRANAAFDVHQRLAPTDLPWTAREHALTQAAWQHSRRIEWEGCQIRVLAPEDAFVFGLVISRYWSGDGWRLKSHDLLDGLALIQHGLTREGVLARAVTLNVSRTVNAFLERCDPFMPRLSMVLPSPLQVLGLELNSSGEHTPLMVSRGIMRVLRTMGALMGALMAAPALLPLWFEVQRQMRRQPDLNLTISALEKRRPIAFRVRHTSLVWWLARRFKQTSRLTWPVMVYIALKRQGLPATFRLGERDRMQRAWVEVNGNALPEFMLEHGSFEAFKVVLTRD
jgi:Uncharacterised nucleotidyltransferase